MLFTGVERVFDPKRWRWNERGSEERDYGAKREAARRQPAGATRETAALQDSWLSDNQPVQVRRHKRGGGATRETLARQERHWRGKRGDNATANLWHKRGAIRQALAW